MKKILFIISFILLMIVVVIIVNPFKKNNIVEKPQSNIKNEDILEIEETKEYIDTNPIIVGLYKNYHNGNNRILIKEYNAKWSYHNDISSFEVFYTNEKEIPGSNQIKTFDLYKNNYENIDDYRIGYIINFSTNEKEINKVIKSPKDTEEFFDYLEIYLYDDYHRTEGVWYSHTTEEEFNDETLLTSIKLTAGKSVNAIISDIKVSAFTYDSDDFNEDKSYRGESIYTITVKRK